MKAHVLDGRGVGTTDHWRELPVEVRVRCVDLIRDCGLDHIDLVKANGTGFRIERG